jgi:hypothetical protein
MEHGAMAAQGVPTGPSTTYPPTHPLPPFRHVLYLPSGTMVVAMAEGEPRHCGGGDGSGSPSHNNIVLHHGGDLLPSAASSTTWI